MASEPHRLVVERARKSLGCYELHIPSILESGEQHQYEAGVPMDCAKNPGHENFIARTKFTLKHLPPGYQDQELFDWVDTTAELTGLLTVRHVSEGRPETFPGTLVPYPCGNSRGQDLAQTGTGFVWSVRDKFYTQVDGVPCPCGVCVVSETPSYSWGRFLVQTATHVVVDDSEARKSDLRLFYRSGGKWDKQVKVANGEKVGNSDIGRDVCNVWYVTHEKELHDTLKETCRRWEDLEGKVTKKYRSYNNNNPVGRPAIIISHPHSAHQYITVGKVTHVEREYENPDITRITYSTDTCSGSSGATVIVPGWHDGWLAIHPHSRACPHGQRGNQSAFEYYYDLPSDDDSSDDSWDDSWDDSGPWDDSSDASWDYSWDDSSDDSFDDLRGPNFPKMSDPEATSLLLSDVI